MSDEVLYDIIEAELKQYTCEGMFGPCPNFGEPIVGRGYDDGKDVIMCSMCAKYYNEHWDEMFNDYYRSVL